MKCLTNTAVIKLICCCLLALPLRHLQVTSAYGYRVHPVTGRLAFHAGIDLRARSDTVFAVFPGLVSSAGYDQYLGIYIRVRQNDLECTFGHLSQLLALPGDSVLASGALGITGSTGRVTGEHLHFSVRYRGRNINPLEFLLKIQLQIYQQKETDYESIQTPVRSGRR